MVDRIGRYEIQGELGRGGFGTVFRAYDPTVGRLVAIKTLTLVGDPELLKRFRNEAAAAGKLRHNNIVIIYDFGEHDGAPYLVMELLDGEDLERIISNRRPLTLLEKVNIIVQGASALHHAHTYGIVHRDVKPANIMLLRDGVVKIMDFGIALLTQATAARLTPQGSIVGTFPYMAPEQFYGSASDVLSDVFAFGVTCYKLVTGVHPFHAEEVGGLMFNIMNKAPEPVRSLSPECPEALEQAIFRMLAKDRDARYQTLEDVRFDLEPVIIDLRRERIDTLLSEARSLIAAQDLDRAQGLVRQVLEVDPANKTAREMREALQRQIRENALRPRIAALIDSGRQRLIARDFEAALEKFNSALQLDKTNHEVQRLISDARSAWEKAQRAGRLVEDARHLFTRGDLTSAHGIVREALSADPQNSDADQLRASIDDRLRSRDRERRLDEALNQAKRLLLIESFEQVIEVLEVITGEYPESSAARELLQKARAGQQEKARRARLTAAVEQAKTFLKSSQFPEALEHLKNARTEFPDSTELRDLQTFANEELRVGQQVEAIRRIMADARQLADARKFDEALNRLKSAVAEYPAEISLRELMQVIASSKAEHERTTALAEASAQAKALLEKQQYHDAVARIAAFERAYGEHSELAALRTEAEQGFQRQRRVGEIRKLVADARALIDEGRPDSATQALQVGTLHFPDSPELKGLLEEAQRQAKQKEEAEAISKVISEAESLARARQFDRALSVVEKGLEDFKSADRLVRCRDAIVAGANRFKNEQQLQSAIERGRALRNSGQIDEALATIDSAIQTYGEDSLLLQLQREISAERSVQQRSAEVRNVIDQAQTHIDAGRFGSATELLNAALKRFPEEKKLASLNDIARDRLREQEREQQLRDVKRATADDFNARRFDTALKRLDAAIKELGPEPDLASARDQVLAAKATEERRRAIEDLRAEVERLRTSRHTAQALDALNRGMQLLGSESGLVALQQQLEAERKVQEQQQRIRDLLSKGEDLLNRGRPQEAVALLENSASQSNDSGVLQLLTRARQRVADQQRDEAIAEIERKARTLLDSGDMAAAVNTVDEGLRRYPGADRLARVRDAAREAQHRANALADVQRLRARGDLQAALEILQQLAAVAHGDREVRQLRDAVQTEIRDRQQAEERQRYYDQARALLESGRLGEANALLRDAVAKHPSDPRLPDLLSKVAEQQRRIEREQALTAARSEAQQLIARRQFAQAVALLNDRFPGEPRVQDLVSKAQDEVDLERRRHERAQVRVSLAEIEQRVASTKKSKLPTLIDETRRLVAPHATDAELAAMARRIEEQATALLSVPDRERRPLPMRAIGIGVGAFAVLGASIFIVVKLLNGPTGPPPVVSPSTVRLTIQTDPPGAEVSVHGQKCTPPNCRLDLPPGQYTVEAHIRGYEPARQHITLDTKDTSATATITLRPEPPPIPAGAAQGTLIVRTGVPEARVLVDNVAQGLTDSRGELRSSVKAGPHSVSVEKVGYKPAPDQSVTIVADKPHTLTVTLARIVPPPPPPSTKQPSGQQQTQTQTQTPPPRTQPQTQPQGQTPQTLPQTQPQTQPQTPTITAEMKEAQDWDKVKNSKDPSVIEGFLRDHRGTSRTAEARRMIDDLTWNAVDRKSPPALQAFIDQNPGSRHKGEAQSILDTLAKEVEQKRLAQQEAVGIRAAIQKFNDSFVHKNKRELQAIWPSAIKDWLDGINRNDALFVATLFPTGEPSVTQDRATIQCQLFTTTVIRGKPLTPSRTNVTVTLRKTDGQWLIENPRGPA